MTLREKGLLAGVLIMTTAPLMDYFGHGVFTVMCFLGVIVLATTQKGVVSGFDVMVRDSSNQIAAALVFATLAFWFGSALYGINPIRNVDSWGGAVMALALLTAFALYARQAKTDMHWKAVRALAWRISQPKLRRWGCTGSLTIAVLVHTILKPRACASMKNNWSEPPLAFSFSSKRRLNWVKSRRSNRTLLVAAQRHRAPSGKRRPL